VGFGREQLTARGSHSATLPFNLRRLIFGCRAPSKNVRQRQCSACRRQRKEQKEKAEVKRKKLLSSDAVIARREDVLVRKYEKRGTATITNARWIQRASCIRPSSPRNQEAAKGELLSVYWSSRTRVFPLGFDVVGTVPMAMAPE
jgi:hypothetical protein